MPSAYLPKDFDPQRPVALIAGRGRYPVLTAAAIRATGVPLRLIAMDDETEPALIASFPEQERVILNVGQVGKMLDTLKGFGAGYALMAGQVKPKKLFPSSSGGMSMWTGPRVTSELRGRLTS